MLSVSVDAGNHAVVVEAAVAPAETGLLRGEPVTIAVLRDDAGGLTHVRIVGGPNSRGGVTRIAGYVVPTVGARVRIDLREASRVSSDAALPAWAPNAPAAVWPASALPVGFTLALPNARDLGDRSHEELEIALRAWPEVHCTAFRARLAPAARVDPGDDGVNAVFWHTGAWPAELVPGVLGQTVVHTDAAGYMHDADIHLNAADFRWAVGDQSDSAASVLDARGVLVHELGHALGLGHTTVPRATMTASHAQGLAWRSLEPDDEDGVCALYPGKGDAACDTGAPCPQGFACVARVCERLGARGEVCSPCARVPGACDGAGDGARCIDIAGGRVCGRGCSVGADCGPRFACAPTTASGDLQCVPTDGCASGPDACTTDAACGGGACRGGACVGPGERDGGAGDGGLDDAAQGHAGVDEGGADGGLGRLSPSGCFAGARGTSGTPGGRERGIFAALVALVSLRRRARRRPT